MQTSVKMTRAAARRAAATPPTLSAAAPPTLAAATPPTLAAETPIQAEEKVPQGKKRPHTLVETTTKTIKAEKPRKKAAAPSKTEPPENWTAVWDNVAEMRAKNPAPVDTMGCQWQGAQATDKKVGRFHTLVALMLSSQTKDAVTHEAMRRLRAHQPDGLTVGSVLAMTPEQLDGYICKVGFHNTKTRHIKAAAAILRAQHGDDIPPTLEGLLALPGVGPKMAYLCMQCAWDVNDGIGVDVHVHRISNRLGWVRTSTPEATRVALEAWLPRDRWGAINPLLVGFGQTVCQPVKPACSACLVQRDQQCPFGQSHGAGFCGGF